MKIIQTLATDHFDSRDYNLNTRNLLYQLISALTVRDVYGPDQEFILITDTKGKNLIERYNFPYSSINTALDDWAYTRPISPVSYKLVGFQTKLASALTNAQQNLMSFQLWTRGGYQAGGPQGKL